MVRLTVNGSIRSVAAEPERNLLQIIREELGLTGTKYGCGEGACGACTVLLDRQPVRACTLDLEQARGREITTIEGLAVGGELHPVQAAFVEAGAMQCGFCTPGMVLAAASLLESNPAPDGPTVDGALAGNICRCGIYQRIRRAVSGAAEMLSEAGRAGPRFPQAPPPLESLAAGAGIPWDLLPTERRDWFRVLPEGLVAVLEPAGDSWAASGGAWIHVGPDGVATAFAGKVDVGQDCATALALLVAEELELSPAAVRMVLGDTDFCPFDIGTFGSRSMPGAGEDVRGAAAGAREALHRIAREQGRFPGWPEYGALLRGRRRVEVVPRAVAVTPPAGWRVAGRQWVRRDATAMVTGSLRYPTDLQRPGMLHGKVLRPPRLAARLVSVDPSRAERMPGVVVVREGDFCGVAAPSPSAAEAALAALEPEWRHELQPGEGSLEEDLRSNPAEAQGWEGAAHHEVGDVPAALEVGRVRLSATYRAAYIAHAPLETRAVLAEWGAGGRLTVWTGTQTPFPVRQQLASDLGLDEARVRVVVLPTGGGFGGRHVAGPALDAARLARAAGRPVKLVWTREEEFRWGYFRPAAVIDVASAADAAGRVTAWRFKNYNAGGAAILTPYSVRNQRIDYQPAVSPLPQGPYRALAATANNFARESQMDELAQMCGRDPLEFRLENLEDERLAAVLRAAAEAAGWRSRPRGRRRGMGIACGLEKGGRIATCVEVEAGSGAPLRILKIVSAYECGAIVNPGTVRSQVEGAAVMALGGALFEAIHFDHGRILNPSFSSYRVPRFTDVPPIDVVLLDRRDIPSAGAGETPMIAVAPALAGAIFEATGIRLRSLPLVPSGRIEEPAS